MSRQIDLTKPLSDEDREYLLARNRKRDVALADANAKGQEPPAESAIPDDSLEGSTDRSPAAIPANAAAQNALGVQAPGSQSLASPATAHQVGDEEHEDNYDDTEAWSYEEIKDEVKSRNSDSAPALNSSREDLVAWLRKDDASDAS